VHCSEQHGDMYEEASCLDTRQLRRRSHGTARRHRQGAHLQPVNTVVNRQGAGNGVPGGAPALTAVMASMWLEAYTHCLLFSVFWTLAHMNIRALLWLSNSVSPRHSILFYKDTIAIIWKYTKIISKLPDL
jgi:hypothetical protein